MTLPLFPSYREIPLSQGQVAIVDDDDYEKISSMKWSATWRPKMGKFYAVGSLAKYGKRVYMHREIMGLTIGDGLLVDHIDHNTLDNRKANLRIVNNSQNMMNHGKIQKNNTSGCRGVHFEKRTNQYRVQVWAGGKPIWGGRHDTFESAKLSYERLAKLHHAEFTCLP